MYALYFGPGPLELIIIFGMVLVAAVVFLVIRKAGASRASPPCPQCGTWTVPGAGFCHRCGNRLPK